MPAWLTIVLLLGIVTLNLALNRVHAVSAPSSNAAATFTNTVNTFTATQTINNLLDVQSNGVGAHLDHELQFTNVATSKPDEADAVGELAGFASSVNAGCSSEQPVAAAWQGVAGRTSRNYGGYWVFWTKSDGACAGQEALVLDPGGHIFPSNSQHLWQITTPARCRAGVPCGTVAYTFRHPFMEPDGVTAEQPLCYATIQDTNSKTNAWVAVAETISSTDETWGYAPVLAQNTARSLTINALCFDSTY